MISPQANGRYILKNTSKLQISKSHLFQASLRLFLAKSAENKFLLRHTCFCEKCNDKREVILLGVYEPMNSSEYVSFCIKMAYLERFSSAASSAFRPC